MKNFNIFAVHGKIRVLEGGFTKNQYIGDDYLERGAWTVCRFTRGLARKRKWRFWGRGGGGVIPKCTLCDWNDCGKTTFYKISSKNAKVGKIAMKLETIFLCITCSGLISWFYLILTRDWKTGRYPTCPNPSQKSLKVLGSISPVTAAANLPEHLLST